MEVEFTGSIAPRQYAIMRTLTVQLTNTCTRCQAALR
jgi:hypothetical protein